MIVSVKTLSAGAAVSGSAMGMLFEAEAMDWQQMIAFALIGLVCLIFGTLGRLSSFDPKEESFTLERRRSFMLFGVLYILSLMTAEALSANIFTMAGIACAYGLAGPFVVKPVVDLVIRLLSAIFPGTGKT